MIQLKHDPPELSTLSVHQLVALVTECQKTIAQLHARVAELEKRSADFPRAPSEVTARNSIAPTKSIDLHNAQHHQQHHRYHHRHRQWHKRLSRALFLPHLPARQYIVIILIMITLALLMGAYIVMTMMQSGGNG